MGLTIQGKHVAVDHSHKNWLLTEPQGNPNIEIISTLIVYSIFKRQKAPIKQRRNRQERPLGDNCPLIYALKGKEELTTDISSIKKLKISFDVIIQDIAAKEPAGFDLIVSMPSAHNISHIVGKRFSRYFNTTHSTDFLRKITINDAYNILHRANVSVEEEKSLIYRIKRQEKEVGYYGNFSLKGIPIEFRNIFAPITLATTPQMKTAPKRILIVDDLLATGTTLITAAGIVQSAFPRSEIRATCLFSSFGKRP